MLRVLYVITELDPGGAEKTLFELARRLPTSDFEPIVASLSGRGAVSEWLEEEGIEVHGLSGRRIRTLVQLRRLIRRLRPDIIHSFLFHANIMSRFAALGLGVKAVVGSVRVAEVNRPFRLLLDRFTQPLTDMQTCVCEAVRQFTIRQARVNASKLVTIPNGIDVSRFEGVAPASLRKELGIPPDAVVVTTVARLDEQKGVIHLVNAACARRAARSAPAGSSEDEPAVHYVIAGDGRCAHKIAMASADFENIHLLGRREDVPSILASSDVFVLPSLWEGMPNAVLEAMASGLPVVACDVGGCAELIEHDRTGLLVPPGNEDALAEAIDRLVGDAETRRNMGNAGRERVKKHFTIDRMVQANIELYRELLDPSDHK